VHAPILRTQTKTKTYTIVRGRNQIFIDTVMASWGIGVSSTCKRQDGYIGLGHKTKVYVMLSNFTTKIIFLQISSIYEVFNNPS
jgi:hypothetical protein